MFRLIIIVIDIYIMENIKELTSNNVKILGKKIIVNVKLVKK
jgi:hypothetical protein